MAVYEARLIVKYFGALARPVATSAMRAPGLAAAADKPTQRAAIAVYSHPSDEEIIAKLFKGRPDVTINKNNNIMRAGCTRKDVA
eukprot:gene7263-7476_t